MTRLRPEANRLLRQGCDRGRPPRRRDRAAERRRSACNVAYSHHTPKPRSVYNRCTAQGLAAWFPFWIPRSFTNLPVGNTLGKTPMRQQNSTTFGSYFHVLHSSSQHGAQLHAMPDLPLQPPLFRGRIDCWMNRHLAFFFGRTYDSAKASA